MDVGHGFGAIVGRRQGVRRRLAVLLCVLGSLPAPGRAQDLEGWIQRLGEAAAESAAPAASGTSGASAPSGATTQDAAAGCVREQAPGDLVVRGSSACAARLMAETVLEATRTMNARAAARDCRGVAGCRHRTSEERLRQVASLNHEEGQMARSHSRGAPSNIALPPPKSSVMPSWTWRPYR